MIVARQVRVTGRVQGVFFRQWTAEQARAFGVGGWVRNCPDGSVEAHLEGEEDAVEALVTNLQGGPPAAKVAHLASEPAERIGANSFEVKR
jgi:acylphosphatase